MGQNDRFRRHLLIVAAIVVTVAPLVVVFPLFDRQELTKAVREWRPEFLLPGLAFMFAHIVLGGLRMRLCTKGVNDRTTFVAVHAVGVLARGAVPAGIGEIVYVSLMRRFCAPQWAVAVSGTVASRCLDVVAGFVALCLLAPWLRSTNPQLVNGLWLGLGVVSAVIVIIACLVQTARDGDLRRQWWPARLLQEFFSALADLRKGRTLVLACFLTLGMQATLFAVYCCLFKTLSSTISFPTIAAVYLLLWPMSLLPVRGFLDLGTHEGSWIVVLLALGFDAGTSSVIAVASHAILFTEKVIVAFVAAVFLFRPAGRRLNRSTAESRELPVTKEQQPRRDAA